MSTVTVVGAGAVGVVLAAAMSDAGHDVVACSRTSAPLAVERDGVVRAPAVRVRTDPATVTGSDWVLLCTKAQDTTSAAPWLSRACHQGTTLLVCQNGIDHVERVGGLAGPADVLPALVYVAAERTGPNRARHRRGAHLVVPACPAGERAAALAPEGIDVRLELDFRTAAWRKLLTNVAANAVTALTGRRMEVLREPQVRQLASTLLTETVEVGRAEGAALGHDDVRATLDFYDRFAPEDGTSMLYDRLAGRPTEHALFNGTVCALGLRHGVPTPVNDAVHALLQATENARPTHPQPQVRPAATTARTA
ncbi:2-dehydropantoate 2-reductase [Prauserella endophytica]|uniref:2-dehydropantoate 2-reductase n=1 Tax=Prauserella endophytica TaxID=1592324 RepID=A0ABY2RYS6_9PSEU|nr:2-dehydropantoate 2-reductase [Prauserella endophytica]TKG65777.1 2-dehydropantoate 2-reductase [Prauserella endophytica]